MCQVVGGRAVDAQAASTSLMGRFETEALAMDNKPLNFHLFFILQCCP
jgi:hypothetical protein